MTDRPLLLTMDGDIARITLNRPKVHNALSIELSDMLVEAIQAIKRSTDTKFVVIKGSGDTFCAGDDISEMLRWGDDEHGNSTQGANGVTRRVRIYQDMANSLEELDKITISAVDGYAVGGGLEITMACDFVIATERAVWGMPEVDSGITRMGWNDAYGQIYRQAADEGDKHHRRADARKPRGGLGTVKPGRARGPAR